MLDVESLKKDFFEIMFPRIVDVKVRCDTTVGNLNQHTVRRINTRHSGSVR